MTDGAPATEKPISVAPPRRGDKDKVPQVTLSLGTWLSIATFILVAIGACYGAMALLFVTRPEFHRLDTKVTAIGVRLGLEDQMKQIDQKAEAPTK